MNPNPNENIKSTNNPDNTINDNDDQDISPASIPQQIILDFKFRDIPTYFFSNNTGLSLSNNNLTGHNRLLHTT